MSVAKQAFTSAEVVPRPATRAAAQPTAATSSSAIALSTVPTTTAPTPTSSASHADLHQFERPISPDLSESPRRPLQISESQARNDLTPTRRNRTTALTYVSSSAEPVIVLDDDDTPPEHLLEQFEFEVGVRDEPAQDVSARDTAVAATELSSTPSIPVSAPVTERCDCARAAAGCNKRADRSVAIARDACYNCYDL